MSKGYHHFKGNDLKPSEKVERKVVQLLLTSKLPDSQRDSSVVFELKHSSEIVQVARILGQKRNLNLDLAEAAAALHDIYVVTNGRYKDHAQLGGPIAQKILEEIGGFTEEEIKTVTDAVIHHSEKDVHTNDPYIELIKDADVFACSLYKNAEAEYRRIKSPKLFQEYTKRVIKVRQELGLPEDPVYRT